MQFNLKKYSVIVGKNIGYFLLFSFLLFIISHNVTGDPLRSYYGDNIERMGTLEKEKAREQLGLNKPIGIQYTIWLSRMIQGDFGTSLKYKQPVKQVLAQFLGNTIRLVGISYPLLFVCSFLLGGYCAENENRKIDKIVCFIGTMFLCIPTFWLAFCLVFLFSVVFPILPSSGVYQIGEEGNIFSYIRYFLLPVFILILEHLFYYSYFIRNRFLEEMKKQYILFALSKGMSRKKAIWNYARRSVLPFFISLFTTSFPHFLGGSYVIEIIFSYKGMGTLAFESAKYHDYSVLMLVCIVTAIFTLFINKMGEILCIYIDPRRKKEWIGGKFYEK